MRLRGGAGGFSGRGGLGRAWDIVGRVVAHQAQQVERLQIADALWRRARDAITGFAVAHGLADDGESGVDGGQIVKKASQDRAALGRADAAVAGLGRSRHAQAVHPAAGGGVQLRPVPKEASQNRVHGIQQSSVIPVSGRQFLTHSSGAGRSAAIQSFHVLVLFALRGAAVGLPPSDRGMTASDRQDRIIAVEVFQFSRYLWARRRFCGRQGKRSVSRFRLLVARGWA